jgi:hypothetical protein
MGGGIISERVATSNRNAWRDHLGIRIVGEEDGGGRRDDDPGSATAACPTKVVA